MLVSDHVLYIEYSIHPTSDILIFVRNLKQCNSDENCIFYHCFHKFWSLKGIHHHIHHFSDPCKSEDVWGGVDAELYMLASDHVLGAKEDELGEFFSFLGVG